MKTIKYFHENEDLIPMRVGDVLLMEDGTGHTAVEDFHFMECNGCSISINGKACIKTHCATYNFHFEQTKP